MAFLKTLIIIVAIWYFFKLAFRFFGPMLLKTAVRKAEQNFQKRAQDYYNQNNESYDNTYTNSNTNQSDNFKNGIPREKRKVGEYIDFEEIK